MKKLFVMFFVLFLSVSLLTGCKNKNNKYRNYTVYGGHYMDNNPLEVNNIMIIHWHKTKHNVLHGYQIIYNYIPPTISFMFPMAYYNNKWCPKKLIEGFTGKLSGNHVHLVFDDGLEYTGHIKKDMSLTGYALSPNGQSPKQSFSYMTNTKNVNKMLTSLVLYSNQNNYNIAGKYAQYCKPIIFHMSDLR